jgi:uncharacterized membrane protein
MKKLFFVTVLALSSMSSFAAKVKCSGTEPFWNASVSNGTMKYLDPSLEKAVSLKVLSTTDAIGYATNNITVIKTKYTRLTTVAGQCNDGMSDKIYSHHAVLEKDGVVLGGCCNLQ